MHAVPKRYQPRADSRVTHPEWARNAAIYQINTRQFTPEGTFRSAAAHLGRLKDLGVTILWLMPVHPIGEAHRKGTLGSPYAVKDYFGVNPELGTLDDLRELVRLAHSHGLYVILDWVGNHTAWDNPLVHEHPQWYSRDWKGDLRPTPWWDWPDVVDLDYSQAGLRQYMTEAMTYWVRELGIDGYRCDVAGFVPTDFWANAREELEAIKPVFLLAEWESRDLHVDAFDATYAWTWNEALHRIAHGAADVNALRIYYSWNEKTFPRNSMRMTFVSNHDKNAWEGTEYEQFGDALDATIVLSVVGEGIPLVYSGQEAGNRRRLAFFERDPIDWRDHSMREFYRHLFDLKTRTTALWNGHWGARMVAVPNDHTDQVLSFVRANERDRVFAAFNFSAQPRCVTFTDTLHHGTYTDALTGEPEVLTKDTVLDLRPWGYRVLVG
jgi:glycosidase